MTMSSSVLSTLLMFFAHTALSRWTMIPEVTARTNPPTPIKNMENPTWARPLSAVPHMAASKLR